MPRRPVDPDPVAAPVEEVAAELARLCPDRGIDLAGAVTLPTIMHFEDHWWDFLAEGRHADLDYLTSEPDERLDPTERDPWARSILVFGQRYTNGWPAGDPDPAAGGPAGAPEDPWTGRVARYARGSDYHDVLLKDIRAVVRGLKKRWPGLVAFPSTDTGPYLEREYAWLAGLGFMGKNTCLIHEKMGSGLFLGVALTNLDVVGLPADQPQDEPLYAVHPRRRRPPRRILASHCGSCTACVDACPTEALLPDGGMDAGQCIATWTIEWRGRPQEGWDAEQGGILFGCDVCQAVCPWNQRAAVQQVAGEVRREYGTRVSHGQLSLADLLDCGDDEFRRRFRRTPMWRAHPDGMARNAATVLENLREEPVGED